MKSVVTVDIDASQKTVATLYADPANSAKWRDDVARFEPISGKQGIPGSSYRLVPKRGARLFTATLVRRLPSELRLNLEGSDVTVDVLGTLSTLPDGRTRFTSKEVFSFKGVWNKAYGILTKPAIHNAHRKHIEAFKKFAERQEKMRWQ
jgi:hypothetical protein